MRIHPQGPEPGVERHAENFAPPLEQARAGPSGEETGAQQGVEEGAYRRRLSLVLPSPFLACAYLLPICYPSIPHF